MTCPDCGADDLAKPHKKPTKSKGSVSWPSGQEYQLDAASAPEPRPFSMPIAVRDAEMHEHARATTVGPDGRLIVQKEERDRRQARPAVPLMQGVWRMLVTEEVIARGILTSIVFGVAAWLFDDSVNTPVAGVAAIASMALMVAFVARALVWLSFAAPLFLAIVAESSEGHDRLHEPPVWSPLDWLVETMYLVAAASAAGLPALAGVEIDGHVAARNTDADRHRRGDGDFSAGATWERCWKTRRWASFRRSCWGRCHDAPGPWLLFYMETTAMWSLAGLAAWGMWQAGDWRRVRAAVDRDGGDDYVHAADGPARLVDRGCAAGGGEQDGRRQSLHEVADRVAEELQAVAFVERRAARPLRVLRAVDEPLGVRHQAEDAAGGVADAGDVALGAVGIARLRSRRRRGVAQHELAGVLRAGRASRRRGRGTGPRRGRSADTSARCRRGRRSGRRWRRRSTQRSMKRPDVVPGERGALALPRRRCRAGRS